MFRPFITHTGINRNAGGYRFTYSLALEDICYIALGPKIDTRTGPAVPGATYLGIDTLRHGYVEDVLPAERIDQIMDLLAESEANGLLASTDRWPPLRHIWINPQTLTGLYAILEDQGGGKPSIHLTFAGSGAEKSYHPFSFATFQDAREIFEDMKARLDEAARMRRTVGLSLAAALGANA